MIPASFAAPVQVKVVPFNCRWPGLASFGEQVQEPKEKEGRVQCETPN
jgi:hypothetical protein